MSSWTLKISSKYDGRGLQKSQATQWKCFEERRFPIKPSKIMIMVSWNCKELGNAPKSLVIKDLVK
jgi:hypothetical protein